MKIDEPFNPQIKSAPLPAGMNFEKALNEHVEEIVQLMAERNPDESIEAIQIKTEREIKLTHGDKTYLLYVATLEGKVIGLCRFYHSGSLPVSKKIFPAQEGWYAMGSLVTKSHRRMNIARFLFEERLKILKRMNVHVLFSAVDAQNLTSPPNAREIWI